MKIKEFLKKVIPWVGICIKVINLYRKANYYARKDMLFLAKLYEYKISKRYSCYISSKSIIDNSLKLPHPVGIVIGEGVKIGKNCMIYQNVTLGRKNKDIPEYPQIGNNVTIYANSVIVGNIIIGSNAVIGCNSVVLRNVEDGEIVCGLVK